MKKFFILIIILSLFQCKSEVNQRIRDAKQAKVEDKAGKNETDSVRQARIEKARQERQEYKQRQKLEIEQKDSTYQFIDSTVIIQGVIQSSGLHDRTELGYKSNFQVIRPMKNFFLVSEKNLTSFWGKHVEVKGKYLNGYDYHSDDFHSTVIKLISIKEIKCDTCTCEPLWTSLGKRLERNDERDTIVSGYITRQKRKVEISPYDYKITFEKPFLFEDYCEFMDSSETILLKEATFVSKIQLDTINYIIENNKKVDLYGYTEGGHYGCRIVFYSSGVKRIHEN